MKHKGSLQIKKGKYYVVIPYKDDFGKNKVKWVATYLDAHNNKTRAAQAMKEILDNFTPNTVTATQTTIGNSDVLFCDFLKSWLEIHKRTIRPSTYAGYSYQIEVLYNYFKSHSLKLKDLKPLHLQAFYEVLARRGLVGNTILHYHVMIRKALQYALKNDLIISNIADKIDRPKKNNFQATFLSKAEIEKLFVAVNGHVLELPIRLAAYYGLRRSEVFGLKWSAIDFDKKTIQIKHQMIPTKVGDKREHIGTDNLKNKSSFRTLPLLPQVETLLRTTLAKRERDMQLYGVAYNKQYFDYVCVDVAGNLLKPDRITNNFKRMCIEIGIRPARFHDLRHTCASLMLADGVPMKQIQEWLGHATFSTTADIYSHLDYSSKLKSAESLTNIYNFENSKHEEESAEDLENEIAKLQERLKKKRQKNFEM
jgi:integrase